MNVLVLGATGYIGSVVAEHLAAAGHRVTALVRPGSRIDRLPANAVLRYGDLSDPATLTAAATDDIDGIINLATLGGAASVDEAANAALLAPLRGTGRPFVYTSGVWILGATGDRVADEATPTNPVDLVAYRPAIERQVLAAAADGVRAVVVRPGIVHGRGGGIPGMFVSLAREHGAGRYVGDAGVRWPMVHVEDLADLFVAALERADAGTVLHGITEEAVPAADVVRAAARAAGVDRVEPWTLPDARAALGAEFADALATDQAVSANPTRQHLGWSPTRAGAVADVATGSYAAPAAA